MKFSKSFLVGLAREDYDDKVVELISTEIVDTTRWCVVYEQIFKFEDNFYSTSYQVGATENQDERPYEWEDDEIDCVEVVPTEKTITVYLPK
jgi:hypothetical protein